MPSYMQMGHDTENLVGEAELPFVGLVLSPVNRYPKELELKLAGILEKNKLDIILDSQLYFPKSVRDKLVDYPYFPSDMDTADVSSDKWWGGINEKLAAFGKSLNVNGITSPAVIPKIFSDDFYSKSVDVGNQLKDLLDPSGIDTYQTSVVDFNSLSSVEKVMQLASILTESECEKFYLIFASDVAPREEVRGSEELFGAMKLIKELKSAGKKVVVAFCASEMPLYKCAGAHACCTGKFFNLRRFTKSRFEEPTGAGGGQLPYWFEQGLMAFLREADLVRISHKGETHLLQNGSSKSAWSDKIIQNLSAKPPKAWLGTGWRQYLSWFSKAEAELDLTNPISLTKSWLKNADNNWSTIDEKGIFFEERKNKGDWIRAWLQALDYFENDK
jgi:hypothetical protein